jgi:hypothetical protein
LRIRSGVLATQLLTEDPELLSDLAALLIVDFRLRWLLEGRFRGRSWGSETDAADVEIFPESIQLEEIRKFQSADISAL